MRARCILHVPTHGAPRDGDGLPGMASHSRNLVGSGFPFGINPATPQEAGWSQSPAAPHIQKIPEHLGTRWTECLLWGREALTFASNACLPV